MRKNNKAFTLIELLAIIVILAIIAVITIPIILNVIENSRKGTAIDSAYGYKDAVIKYYVSNMLENQDLKLENVYTIDEYGKILGETNQYDIPLSGTKPSGGYLIVTNNSINDGCLTIGDYKVTLEDGNAKAEKGQCEGLSLTACDSPLFHPSEEDWFEFENGTITGYSGSATNIIIPCTINGVPVIGIGDQALLDKKLESVVLNDNINTIGRQAFGFNGLKYVKFGSNVESIDAYAFEHNNLTNIDIPDKVESIGEDAFIYNQLTELKIPNTETTIDIDWSAFENNSITKIEIGKGITKIPDNAFSNYGNKLEVVVFSEGLTNIGTAAFAGHKLTEIIIPDSVENIGNQAFVSNQLKNVKIGSKVTSIGTAAFAGNQLTGIEIPRSVKTILPSAFAKASNSNPNLSTIINKSESSFDWKSIINYTGDDDTLTCKTGNFRVTEEEESCYGVTISDK